VHWKYRTGIMNIERDLYRIITGRLQFARDGLFLYIKDPDPELKLRSYIIYDEVYERCMESGMMVEKERLNMLVEKNLWTPLDDREADRISKEIEDYKLMAFERYYKKKELVNIKAKIRRLEEEKIGFISKKYQYTDLTCEGMAEQARREWIITNSVCLKDGTKYTLDSTEEEDILDYCMENAISNEKIRAIARNEPWRSMWLVANKVGDLFNKPTTEYTDYQTSLCSYSIMYDNIYQSPDYPPDEVIQDDDCLDGWFIGQRRDREENRKEKNTKTLFSQNVARHQEIFVMAQNEEDAKNINEMNSERGKQIIGQRAQKIEEKGRVKQGEFDDVAQAEQLKANQMMLEKLRGRK
jgi:hypothetical protein